MFSFKFISILAIAATLFFIVLVALQAIELAYYSADPSVWPVVSP